PKLKRLLIGLCAAIVLILFSTAELFSQSTCSTAVTININTQQEYNITGTEYWIQFTATTSTAHILITQPQSSPIATLTQMSLYENSCNNLNLLESTNIAQEDSSINVDNLNAQQNYYIKIEQNQAVSGYFGLLLAGPITVNVPLSCPPPYCNLVPNGYFVESNINNDLMSYWNNQPNPTGADINTWNNPFGLQITPYSNVCGWGRGYYSQNTPQLRQEGTVGNYNYFLYMWINPPNYGYESVYSIINNGQAMTTGAYVLKFKYRSTNYVNGIEFGLLNVPYTPTTPNPFIITNHSITTTANWQPVNIPFTIGVGQANLNYLYIRPDGGSNGHYAVIYIDDVEIVPTETASITSFPSTAVCPTNPVQLTANLSGNYTNQTYQWSSIPAGFSSTLQSPTVTPTVTTTYTVTITYSDHCEAIENIVVNTLASPIADAGVDVTICQGESTILDASGSSGTPTLTYTWDNGLGAGISHTVNPIVTTTYTVTVVDGNSCSNTDAITVNITNPTYNPSMAVPEILGDNNTCDANLLFYEIKNPSPLFSYIWEINPIYGQFTTPFNNVSDVWINWTNIPFNGAEISVKVIEKASCQYNYTVLNVFECCTPSQYDHNIYNTNILNYGQTTFNNEVVVINGIVEIDDNVQFSDCQIYFGAMAKLVINDDFDLIFDNCNLTACHEYWLWDGIYLNHKDAFLEISNYSTIKNALNAVVSRYGSTFDISSTEFDLNYKGIVVETYNYQHSGKIISSVFSCTSNSLNKLPHFTERSYAGIEVNSVKKIIIGDSTSVSNSNVFKNQDFGIKATDSYIRILNNEFTNMQFQQIYSFPGPYPDNSYGIYSEAINNDPNKPLAKIYIGGDNSAGYYKSNSFINCEHGILAYSNKDIHIIGNIFDFNYQDNGLSSAIRIYHITPTNAIAYIIGNTVDGYITSSIECTNYTKALISCNEINMDVPTTLLPNDMARGILTKNVAGQIEYNNITSNSTTTSDERIIGIQINLNGWTNVGYNEINDVGVCINPYGNSPGAYYANILNSSNKGIQLSDVSGLIGPQGADGSPYDNEFYGTFGIADTYCEDADGSNSPFWVQNAAPYLPLVNSANNPYPFTINTTTGNYASYDPDHCTNIMADYASGGGGKSSSSQSNLISQSNTVSSISTSTSILQPSANFLAKIINDSINYNAFIGESKWINKYHLLEWKAKQPVLSTNTSLLSSFSQSMMSNSIGKTHLIHQYIENNNINLAKSLNNALNTTNKMDSCFKVFNTIFLNSIVGDSNVLLSNSEENSLKALAQKCPFEYGPSVYSAREVLRQLGDTTYWLNICEYNDTTSNLEYSYYNGDGKNPNNQEQEELEIQLFPNPAKNQLTFICTIPEEQSGELKIYDVTGGFIAKYNLNEGNNKLLINTEKYNAGIYFYYVKINGAIKANDKIVIIK
ncbi:MAG: T9SS type A sorting domain-containing protein, partial [Saprospiraceae bacterium]|nr:T9SS type A sorting domain-containing protein [Saprospiraceae bacterium]